jgi:hypothetical protein
VKKRHCDRNEGPLAWSEDGGEIEAAPAAMDANATLLATNWILATLGIHGTGEAA